MRLIHTLPLSPYTVLLFAVLLLLPACSSESYLEDADNEVYDIIEEKQNVVLGKVSPFIIDAGELVEDIRREARMTYEPEDTPKLQTASLTERKMERTESKETERELPPGIDVGRPVKVSLVQALEIAFRMNRDYKSRKEDLYLQALTLTFQRHLWTPIFSGDLSGSWERNSMGERFVSGSADFSMSQLLSTGGEITLNFLTDVLRIYSPDLDRSSSSLFSLSFLQPLWRGAGSLVAQENLTQAERNVAYEIRDFERFRKNLAVDVAADYYDVLSQLDTVNNEKNNYESLITNRERSELMFEAGRLPGFEVDQSRQNELSAKNRWVIARQRYENLLDSFKIRLGLPMEVQLELDRRDFDMLTEGGLRHPDVDLEKAITEAMDSRLDLMNSMDQVNDAKRRVLVAEDGLGPDLNFAFNYSIDTEGDNKPLKFETDNPAYGAGLELDLPLDRKSERNAFRQSLIDLERQKRSRTLLEDSIKRDVRSSYRTLQEAKESYEIQRVARELADKRVESTELLLQAGRAQTRDLLDSKNDLLNAQNALTAAIVTHTIARLEFLLDVEALEVNDKGIIQSLSSNEGGDAESLEDDKEGNSEDD